MILLDEFRLETFYLPKPQWFLIYSNNKRKRKAIDYATSLFNFDKRIKTIVINWLIIPKLWYSSDPSMNPDWTKLKIG